MGNGAKGEITDGMPVGIVDAFEVIAIDQQCSELLSSLLRSRSFRIKLTIRIRITITPRVPRSVPIY